MILASTCQLCQGGGLVVHSEHITWACTGKAGWCARARHDARDEEDSAHDLDMRDGRAPGVKGRRSVRPASQRRSVPMVTTGPPRGPAGPGWRGPTARDLGGAVVHRCCLTENDSRLVGPTRRALYLGTGAFEPAWFENRWPFVPNAAFVPTWLFRMFFFQVANFQLENGRDQSGRLDQVYVPGTRYVQLVVHTQVTWINIRTRCVSILFCGN